MSDNNVHSMWDHRVKKAAKDAEARTKKQYAQTGRQPRSSKLDAAMEKYGSDKGLQHQKKKDQEKQPDGNV